MRAIKFIKWIEFSCFIQVPICVMLYFNFIELSTPIGIISLVWMCSVFLWQDMRWELIRKRDNKKYIEAIEKLAEESVDRFCREIGYKKKNEEEK